MDHEAFAQLLGNYGEFFGAIAVVVTLGYLAVQIRQNTHSNYVNRGDTARQLMIALSQDIVKDRDLAELVAQCRAPDALDLTPADEERIERLAHVYITTFAGIERAYQNGELPDEQYQVNIGESLGGIAEAYPVLSPVFE
jgi:hypothetical protein